MQGAFLLWAVIVFSSPSADLIKKAGDLKKYPDNHLLLIYDSIKVEVKPSGLSYFYTHKLYKVLTRKGALDLSIIKYDYDPLTAYADIVKAIIYRKDGRVEEVDIKKVYDYPAPARGIYWGAREKMLETGRLEPGDGLEVMLFKKGFSYALLDNSDDDKYIPPMFGSFYDIVPFWSDDAAKTLIQTKVYQLRLPSDKKLQYKFYYGEVEESINQDGDKTVYVFTKKDIKPFGKEPFMVSLYDVAPKLLLSTATDWQSKSRWFYKVNEDFGSFESTPEIKSKVSEILKGAKNETDSVSRLTHWAGDEIRYSGLTMGKGEGFTLHKGSMTFLDRCGVCKDKAGMLITLLRAAGFESYPAMTMAGSRIDEIPADHFNHCVTAVRLKDGKLHMLDPTWVPFRRELWSSAEQQQNYLIGTPQGEPLEEIPLSPAENHYVYIDNNSELTKDGTLNGELTITAEGQSDAAVRSMFTGYFRSQWNSNAEKELLEIEPDAKILSVDYGDPWDYISSPVKVVIKYTIPEFAVKAGDVVIFRSLLASHIFRRAQNHFNFDTSLVTRKYAFKDRCSRLVKITDNIKIPTMKDVVYMPQEIKVEGKAAAYRGNYNIKNNNLKLEEVITLNKRVYESGEWVDFRNVVIAQKKMNDEKIIIRY
jgi:transglutaminase-like putative cysteine protease